MEETTLLNNKSRTVCTNLWLISYWILFVSFLFAGALNMMEVSGGFLTNHLADFVGPAWLYIASRRLHNPRRKTRLNKLFGSKPEISALIIFTGSSLTEISQYYWPMGIFPGTFDPFDIIFYALGLAICYVADKLCV